MPTERLVPRHSTSVTLCARRHVQARAARRTRSHTACESQRLDPISGRRRCPHGPDCPRRPMTGWSSTCASRRTTACISCIWPPPLVFPHDASYTASDRTCPLRERPGALALFTSSASICLKLCLPGCRGRSRERIAATTLPKPGAQFSAVAGAAPIYCPPSTADLLDWTSHQYNGRFQSQLGLKRSERD